MSFDANKSIFSTYLQTIRVDKTNTVNQIPPRFQVYCQNLNLKYLYLLQFLIKRCFQQWLKAPKSAVYK